MYIIQQTEITYVYVINNNDGKFFHIFFDFRLKLLYFFEVIT